MHWQLAGWAQHILAACIAGACEQYLRSGAHVSPVQIQAGCTDAADCLQASAMKAAVVLQWDPPEPGQPGNPGIHCAEQRCKFVLPSTQASGGDLEPLMSWHPGCRPDLSTCWLQAAFLEVDSAFRRDQDAAASSAQKRSSLAVRKYPGSTAIAALIHGRHLHVANAGANKPLGPCVCECVYAHV